MFRLYRAHAAAWLRLMHTRDDGVTAVEYAVMAAAVAGVVIAIAFALGHGTSTKFVNMSTSLANGS